MRKQQFSTSVSILLSLILFVVVTAIAGVLGAPNLGYAATFGQIAFGAIMVWFLLCH